MRLTIRLWLALLVAIVVVMSVGLAVRVRQEEAVLVEVTLRDRRFFAHALQTALQRPGAASEPLAEAERLLGRDEIAAGHISTRVLRASKTDDTGELIALHALAPELTRGEVAVLAPGEAILTYVPLDPRGEVLLELREPDALREQLAELGYRSLAVQLVALAGFAALASWWLVRWMVGAPVSKLVRLTRRFADGDLEATVYLPERTGEIAELGRELHHMASQLATARRRLDELEVERVGALEALRHADRLRTVGLFASSLAHELGTPLNVVSGHARMIEDEGELSPSQRESAETIREQVARMSALIRGLLGFARRRVPRREQVDLGELARRAARTLEPLTRQLGVHVTIDAPAAPVAAWADAEQLLQVLTNLVMNAAAAMPSGGQARVEVAERDAEPPVGVHAAAGAAATIAVVDEGSGIAMEDLPHLFEPFFTHKAEGTGLGLAVVHGIVRDHGGWIEVRSVPGVGSRFEVVLPRAEQAAHGEHTDRTADDG